MKFLMAGLGSIGRRHLANLADVCSDAQFFAYRERGLPLGEFGEKYGIDTFSDLGKALSLKYDAVFITNPTVKHVALALEAARMGYNLFLEKPVSNSMEGIAGLRELVQAKGLITMVGFNMRFHPAVMKMKELIAGGRLGKLYFARLQNGEYLPDWHPDEDYRSGYSARKELGGGALLTQIHEIDYLLWLKDNPSRICAMTSKVSDLDIDVEDNVEILLGYKDGFIAEININYLQREHSRGCQIVGEKGSLYWDYHANTLTLYYNDSRQRETVWSDPGFERNAMFREEVRHFIDCIREKKETVIDLGEGLKSLRIALAAKESDSGGEFVNLEG